MTRKILGASLRRKEWYIQVEKTMKDWAEEEFKKRKKYPGQTAQRVMHSHSVFMSVRTQIFVMVVQEQASGLYAVHPYWFYRKCIIAGYMYMCIFCAAEINGEILCPQDA